VSGDVIRLVPGTVFAGDYKVVRPLRTGGQGSLYVVEQISTSKHRALKLMLPELVANPTSRKRFELEAKIAARIQSDHIVETIASGVDPKSGVPWLAMELLEGEDLATRIQKKRSLPPGDVLEIFGQLCHALGEAHRQGVVHRDLKPENIFLAASRRRGMPFMVKVLDFGIARVMAEAKTQSGATVTGLGTPMWMAPEQTIPGGRVEPSTDVWPLGLLAFRLLTGYLFWKAPYDPSASVLMLMAEAFMHPMPTASKRAADYKCAERIPPGFDAWFGKAVARNMDERFPDATAAFTALEPILAAAAETYTAPAGGAAASITGPTPPVTSPGVQTGPGRATWEGAPELGQDAVLSAADEWPSTSGAAAKSGGARTSEPVAAEKPRASEPAIAPSEKPRASAPSIAAARASEPAVDLRASEPLIPTSTPRSATSEQAPPVQKSAAPAARGKSPTAIIAAACVAGVIAGVGIFAWSRGGKHANAVTDTAKPATTAAPSATASASAAPSATTTATASADTEPAASVAGADSAAAVPSAGADAGVVGGRRTQKLCKPAGQKCFSNDDCCERVCRQWTCRANAALRDPYGNDK
jgi:serine/threonine protein kinase